jgi:hypothetical protein
MALSFCAPGDTSEMPSAADGAVAANGGASRC